MVTLPYLTWDCQRLIVLGPGLIVVPHSLFDVAEELRVKQVANDDQPGPSFTSFAMDSDNRVFQEHIFDDLPMLGCEFTFVFVIIQTIFDVSPLLSHSLQE